MPGGRRGGDREAAAGAAAGAEAGASGVRDREQSAETDEELLWRASMGVLARDTPGLVAASSALLVGTCSSSPVAFTECAAAFAALFRWLLLYIGPFLAGRSVTHSDRSSVL
jgi:hypothetical protein